jgi:hypothetical protein
MRIWKIIVLGMMGLPTMIVQAATLAVNPNMHTTEINALLQTAQSGDTILFAEGSYQGNYLLENLHGKLNHPVVIKGEDSDRTIIDGEVLPGTNMKHNAFRLDSCSWISIENFTIKNCWLDLVRAENSSYISLRGCKMYGGKRALFATGRGSHHFLVEQCTWEQDERVWSHTGDYSWDEIHHGIHKHYNGSLFQGNSISGVFVLRDNKIRNTFNAFRLSQINDGTFDPLACSNGEIYRNTIFNTSDNVLEPEVNVFNLHFYHNTMVNGHAFISITEVQGGELYVYGNTVLSMPESEDGWTIFKISSEHDSLSLPFYIFNNSWQVDFDMIGSPRHVWENSHVHHFNNACYSEASDTFGIYNLGIDNHFDYDCSNVPFPALLLSAGHEENGIVADPLFRDALAMDFRLKKGSPCIDEGKKDIRLLPSYEGKRPDIGAYDGEHRVEGPPFRYMEPEVDVSYVEFPRITRVMMDRKAVRFSFSLPMNAVSMEGISFRIVDGNRAFPLDYKSVSSDGYILTLTGKELAELNPGERSGMQLQISRWPLGRNGRPLTSWASEINVIRK